MENLESKTSQPNLLLVVFDSDNSFKGDIVRI